MWSWLATKYRRMAHETDGLDWYPMGCTEMPGDGARIACLDISETKEAHMNWDQIEGNWKQFKGKAKQKWGKLTDDELDVIAGKKDELVGKIQERYGKKKEDAEDEVDRWLEAS